MRTPLTALAAFCVLACGDEATPTIPKEAPPAPASVSAKIVNDNLELTWADVPGATSYNVYMAAENGVKRVNYTSLTANMFHPGEVEGKFDHPPGLDPNMKYYMVVTAVNANGESAESCEVGAVVATKLGESC
jgi:fibronectin type 3 domain-containing protein